MKKYQWIMWIVFIAVLLFLLPRLSEQGQLLEALKDGKWWWLTAAFLMSIVNFGLVAEIYRRGYRMVGVPRTYRDMLSVFLASVFVNTITPSMGAAGLALFIKDTRHHGFSHMRGMIGFALETMIVMIGFSVTLMILFLFLLAEGTSIEMSEVFLLIVVIMVVGSQIGLYVLALFKPSLFEKLLGLVSGAGNWISRRLKKMHIFPDGWSSGRVAELQEMVKVMVREKRNWLSTLVICLGSFIAQTLMVIFLLLAFNQEVHVNTLVGVFAGTALAGFFFTGPHGIGVVEVGLTLILSHYGVDRGAATLIAIVYRGCTFWLPFFVGFFAFRTLKLFNGKKDEKETEKETGKETDGETAMVGPKQEV